jgi:hypothetical protein
LIAVKAFKRQLLDDLHTWRRVRAIGPQRPIIRIKGGLPGTSLFATLKGRVYKATVWESDAEFVTRVASEGIPGTLFVGGLPPMPGTNVIMPA